MIETIHGLVRNKSYPQILLMFGDEEYLMEESYNELMASLMESGVNEYDSEIFDAEDSGGENLLDRIVASCEAYPFVSERRVVVVKHFNKLFSNRTKKFNEKSAFARYLGNAQKTSFLILLAEVDNLNGLAAALKDTRNTSKAQKIMSGAKYPYNIILDKYSWIEFPKVYESGYSGWLKKRFIASGKSINDDACQYLIANTAGSLRELDNQADKIITFLNEKSNADLETVSGVIGFSRVYNVFELQKAVGRRDLNNSLKILDKMLRSEPQEILILTMLTRYFVSLWKLAEAGKNESDIGKIAESSGINRYFLNEYMDALQKYTIDEIDQAFIHLSETDELLKSTSIDKPYLMQELLIKLVGRK